MRHRTRFQRLWARGLVTNPLTIPAHARICELAAKYREDFWNVGGFLEYATKLSRYLPLPFLEFPARIACSLDIHFETAGGMFLRCHRYRPFLLIDYIIVDPDRTNRLEIIRTALARAKGFFYSNSRLKSLLVSPDEDDSFMLEALAEEGFEPTNARFRMRTLETRRLYAFR